MTKNESVKSAANTEATSTKAAAPAAKKIGIFGINAFGVKELGVVDAELKKAGIDPSTSQYVVATWTRDSYNAILSLAEKGREVSGVQSGIPKEDEVRAQMALTLQEAEILTVFETSKERNNALLQCDVLFYGGADNYSAAVFRNAGVRIISIQDIGMLNKLRSVFQNG